MKRANKRVEVTCCGRAFHIADHRQAGLDHRRLRDVYGGQSNMSTRQRKDDVKRRSLETAARYSGAVQCRQTFVHDESEFEFDPC